MMSQLRPLSLGEILDRTAQLYRRNFLLFVGVSAAPTAVIVAVSAVFGAVFAATAVTRHGTVPAGAAMGLLGLMFLALAPLLMAATVFSQAGLTQAALSAQNGQTLKIREALGRVRPRFWRYLGLMLLQGLLAAGIPGVIAAGAIGGLAVLFRLAGAGPGANVEMGFLIFLIVAAAIVIAVWRFLGYAMGLASCVVEGKTAWESIERAVKLSIGARGRIFVMFLLVWALSLVMSMVVYIPVAIMAGIVAAMGHGAQYAATVLILAEVLNVLGNFVLQTLIAPVYLIALLLFYFDQRVRSEGYDIERMMDEAGLSHWAGADSAPSLLAGEAASAPAMTPDTVKEL